MTTPLLTWLGHDAFLIVSDIRVYINPYLLKKDAAVGDVILFTGAKPRMYEEFCRSVGIKTCIVVPRGGGLIDETKEKNIQVLSPGESVCFGTVRITAKESFNGAIGYVVQTREKSVYHAGEGYVHGTPGCSCDIALLPVAGDVHASPDYAAESAAKILPGLAIPMRYGDSEGTIADAMRFVRLTQPYGIKTKLLTPP